MGSQSGGKLLGNRRSIKINWKGWQGTYTQLSEPIYLRVRRLREHFAGAAGNADGRRSLLSQRQASLVPR